MKNESTVDLTLFGFSSVVAILLGVSEEKSIKVFFSQVSFNFFVFKTVHE